MTSESSPFVDSCIYGVVGLPIGLFVGTFIPTVVFYTTKPLHFMDGIWIWGMALIVSATLSFSAWLKKSKRTPVKRIIFASLIGVSTSCLLAFPVSFCFAHAHKNDWASREGFGDYLKWMTPFSYLILSVGVIAYVVVVMMPTRARQVAEQDGESDS